MPDAEAIRQALERRLIGFSVGRLAWQKITDFAAGLSTADVVAAAEDAARRAVLADHRAIATGDLIGAIERRRSLQGIGGAVVGKKSSALSSSRDRGDRTSVVSGKSVSGRVDHGGRRIIKKKQNQNNQTKTIH